MSLSPGAIRRERRNFGTPRKTTERRPYGVVMPPSPSPPSPQPIRVRRSEIRPHDATMPMANQFAETVKKSSAYLLKSIGAKRPDLRERLNTAYISFFRKFDDWMKTSGRRSQRKINEPAPNIPLFEEKKKECIDKMDPLMREFHAWSNADAMLPARFSMNPDDLSDEAFDDPISCDAVAQFLPVCSTASLRVQQGLVKLHELETVCQKIEDELQHSIEIDARTQIQLCQILHV